MSIQGSGKPRIVTTHVPYANYLVDHVEGNTIFLYEITIVDEEEVVTFPSLTADVVGRYIVASSGEFNDPCEGKIISYANNSITVDVLYSVNGLAPTQHKALGIWGRVIDFNYYVPFVQTFLYSAKSFRNKNGDITKRDQRWLYKVQLDFSSYMTRSMFEQLEELFNLEEDFYFLPHQDNIHIRYRVNFEENFALSYSAKKHFNGHKDVIIKLRGTEKLMAIDLTTGQTDEFGFGDFFGQIN